VNNDPHELILQKIDSIPGIERMSMESVISMVQDGVVPSDTALIYDYIPPDTIKIFHNHYRLEFPKKLTVDDFIEVLKNHFDVYSAFEPSLKEYENFIKSL